MNAQLCTPVSVHGLSGCTRTDVIWLSEDDGHVGRTYWLWAESKQEVEAWIEALRYSQKYYKHKQDDEQHMEQHMELGTFVSRF